MGISKIRKFTTDYSRTASKRRKQHKIHLEYKLNNLENYLTSEENRKLYNHYKTNKRLFIVMLPTA